MKKVSSILLLMGFFSMYCGFIYGQFFSVSLVSQMGCYSPVTFTRRFDENCHNFGIDWIWGIAGNATTFLNSFKMKFALIIGVVQMLLGLILKITNTVFFKNYTDLFFEAIPQFLFMFCIFGYMCLCIIIKWLTPYVPGHDVSILAIFINFPFVNTSTLEPLFGGENVQQNVQITLMAIAVVSVVVMFIPKPLILYFRNKKKVKYHVAESRSEVNNSLEDSFQDVN